MAGLPADLSGFVGRREELAQLRRLLTTSRLITLTGPGGAGKTRLALQTARAFERVLPDGVRFVDLSPVEDPRQVAHAVAAALEVPDTAGADPTVVLEVFLANAHTLIVLDNCEQVAAATAALVERLLARAPALQFLVTSRESLLVPAEHVVPVPPLRVPEGPITLAQAMASDAVALFVERTSARVPGFQLTADNYEAAVRLCKRLEGLPLAIELAAARAGALSLGEILARLDAPLDFLTEGSRTAPARQRTLHATVSWSFDLCPLREQALWAGLSVFSSSFDIEAAESVADENVLDGLAGLVDKSVLLREADAPRARYRMLETIRDFGRNKLAERGDALVLRRRHRDHYLGLVRQAEACWFGTEQTTQLERCRLDLPDLGAALSFSLGDVGETGAGRELACALWWFWITRGVRDGRYWLDRVLSARPAGDARARRINGWLALAQGDASAARRMLSGPADGVAVLRTAVTDHHEGGIAPADAALAWCNLPTAAALVGDLDRAEALCLDWTSMCEAVGEQWARSWALWVLAVVRWRQGETAAAQVDARESLLLKRSLGDQLGTPPALALLARFATAGGDPELGAFLHGAAESLWEPLGRPAVGWGTFRDWAEQWRAESAETLGKRAFETAYAAGRASELDEAVALAVGEKRKPVSRPAAAPELLLLTRREAQVAKLIAEGRSNREIADGLVISQRTAETHVANILGKLGFSSRAQVAAWISQQ